MKVLTSTEVEPYYAVAQQALAELFKQDFITSAAASVMGTGTDYTIDETVFREVVCTEFVPIVGLASMDALAEVTIKMRIESDPEKPVGAKWTPVEAMYYIPSSETGKHNKTITGYTIRYERLMDPRAHWKIV